MEDYNEVLRMAWLVAGWNLVKELSNKAPSLVSMSKNCWQWEGGSYDRAGCVSNEISTLAFVLTFFFILLFQLVEAIKHSEEDHLFGCLLSC